MYIILFGCQINKTVEIGHFNLNVVLKFIRINFILTRRGSSGYRSLDGCERRNESLIEIVKLLDKTTQLIYLQGNCDYANYFGGE